MARPMWLRTLAATCAVMAIAFAASAGAAHAQPASVKAESYTFAFRDAEAAQVIQEVLGAVGAPYAIDPAVNGRLSFRIEQRLTREQLLSAFEAALEANGIALVRSGDQLVATPQAKAKSSTSVRRRSEANVGSGFEVVAVPLAYAQPSEVAKALEAISAASAVVHTDDRLGLLVLSGTGQQLKTTMDTIKIFDQSAFEDSKIRWFELTQSQAGTVAAELERIVKGAKLPGVAIVPLRRLNGVIVFGRSGDSLGEIARWVGRLDTAGKESSSSLWVYRPKAASAEGLAKTLNTVLGFQASAETSSAASTVEGAGGTVASGGASVVATSTSITASPGADDQVRIGVDKDTNTLIIFAAPERWVQIQKILAEIDRTPRQILIEASILEVTLGKDFEFGVDWSVLSGDLQVSSVNNNTGRVGPTFPGLSITFLNNDIEAAVSALGSRTYVDVVSAPKIIALDNRTARLQVGDQVPVVTRSSQSQDGPNSPLVNSVDYRSTGVILTVTPRVSGENQLTLEVNQEVSSVARTSSSGIDSPTIQQRRFESALVMYDGAVVALGGLISSTKGAGQGGVPWLQDVPGVGALFRSSSRNSSRTELIVLLTAHIIRDRAASDAAMRDLFDDMQELQVRGLLPAQP